MARRSSPLVVVPLVVYPLAAVGVMAIYLHYWGRKLGTS
jgi:hypothetical protein